MRNLKKTFVLALMFVLTLTCSAFAKEYSWVGPTGGKASNWESKSNWDLKSAPMKGGDAVFKRQSDTADISINKPVSINSIVWGKDNDSRSLHLTLNSNLTVNKLPSVQSSFYFNENAEGRGTFTCKQPEITITSRGMKTDLTICNGSTLGYDLITRTYLEDFSEFTMLTNLVIKKGEKEKKKLMVEIAIYENDATLPLINKSKTDGQIDYSKLVENVLSIATIEADFLNIEFGETYVECANQGDTWIAYSARSTIDDKEVWQNPDIDTQAYDAYDDTQAYDTDGNSYEEESQTQDLEDLGAALGIISDFLNIVR